MKNGTDKGGNERTGEKREKGKRLDRYVWSIMHLRDLSGFGESTGAYVSASITLWYIATHNKVTPSRPWQYGIIKGKGGVGANIQDGNGRM